MAANSHVTEPNLTLDQSIRDSSPIVIFQCKGCKSVLGDSSAFVASDRELEVICVNGVTSVVTSAEVLETSTEGADVGSTFRPLHCSSCKLIIGRVYKTTPKEFDHFRNMFCFDREQIDSYQVGSLSEKQSTALNTEQILDIPTARTLETRISKVECVVMMLVEKVGHLGDTANKENVSTMSTNQSVDNPMDSCDTSEEKEQEKVKKPGRKKRK